MAVSTACFIQFPHPGAEHNPPGREMPWNSGTHRRKFLVSPGRFVDGEGDVDNAELVFWAEWEPPSRIERRWPSNGHLPRALHRPHWFKPATDAYRQNTDPWVWGERPLYSNCKQTVGGSPTSMQNLPNGSVVCFGSTIGGEFCLDTVFVIAAAERWVPSQARRLDVDRAFVVCTAESVATNPRDASLSLTLYRGATIEDPVEGMFSFVPARRAETRNPRFARPTVVLPGLINASNRQSPWGSKRALPVNEVRNAWDTVCTKVLDANLVLAVRLQTPVREKGGAVGASTQQRC